MERKFRIPEISDELGLEGKLAIVGGSIGLIGGVTFDMYYLNHPGANFDDRIANLRTSINNLDSLRGDLHILPPQSQAVVKNFIRKDATIKHTEIRALAGRSQPPPHVYEEIGVAAASTAFFGGIAVVAASLIQNFQQRRISRRAIEAQAYEDEVKIQEEADRGLELIDLWRKRQ
jgi:hypothetical protein